MRLLASIIVVWARVLWSVSARAAVTDGLIARYDFDEASGDIARDASGNGRDGAIHRAKRVEAGRGFCLEFDGDDDVDCGPFDAPQLSAMTVQAWIRPAVIPDAEAGIIGRGESFDQSFGLTYFVNGGCYFYAGGGANNCLATTAPQMWHHVAATFDGSHMLLYDNGRQVAQRTLAPRIKIPNIDGRLIIGRNGNAHFRGMIDNVRIYDRALPASSIRATYEAELDQVIRPTKRAPLTDSKVIHEGNDFSVRVGDRDSAIEIAVGAEKYRITSAFSFVGGTVLRKRTVHVPGDRIEVEDELTNAGAEPVAILVQHRIAGGEIFRQTLLGGGEVSTVVRVAENPTLFLSQRSSSLGVLAEDNVLRLQVEAQGANDVAEFAVRHFALAGGATHRFRWSIHPFSRRADYFDFVNAIRSDWNANYRIDGPFDWLEVDHPRTIALLSDPAKLKSHLARRPLKLVALLPFLSYHAGAPLSRDQYRDLMRNARFKLKEAAPDIRCLGSIENNIVSYDRAKLTAGSTLDNVCRNSGAYPLALSELQTAMLRAQLPWSDSLVINRGGRAMVEDCMPTSFVHPMVYAAPANRHSAYLMEQATFLIEDVGLDGIYIDHFNMAFDPQQRFDHSKWDGVSVNIDPQTNRIAERYTDAALVGIPPRETLARYVLGAGKAMVVNTPNVANELRSLPIMHLEEAGETSCRAWKPGEEPPLIPQLARLQLSSPIAIGVPSSNRAEPHVQDVQEVAKAIILYLRHGLLYYHNQTLVPESGPGSGEYGPVNQMFPITPVAFHKGSIEGNERSITCVSREFLVPGDAPPTILLFDLSGRSVAHLMKPVRGNGPWKVNVKLKDWAEIAIVVTASDANRRGAVKP